MPTEMDRLLDRLAFVATLLPPTAHAVKTIDFHFLLEYVGNRRLDAACSRGQPLVCRSNPCAGSSRTNFKGCPACFAGGDGKCDQFDDDSPESSVHRKAPDLLSASVTVFDLWSLRRIGLSGTKTSFLAAKMRPSRDYVAVNARFRDN